MSISPRELNGRRVIYTTAEAITSENLSEELQKAMNIHEMNAVDIRYLRDYYKGRQPILGKKKEVRPEINNKIVENHAMEIVDFKKGYVFGEPIQYIRRGKDESVSEKIDELNEFMLERDKFALDDELAEDRYITGTSYRIVLPSLPASSYPFDMEVLKPEVTFVVYSNDFRRQPLLGVTYSLDDEYKIDTLYCYTATENFIMKPNAKEGYDEVHKDHHILGGVPIVEYPHNHMRIGAFEPVLSLLEAINGTTSDRMDGITQFVQSFMKFTNCDIDEELFIQLRQLGAIKVQSIDSTLPADVDIVSSELNQDQIQVTKDDLYQTVLIICGMPDRKSTKSGGDTGQAVILRDGWGSAESRARSDELMFKRSEKQMLSLVLNILSQDPNYNMVIEPHQFEVKFTRNRTDNLLVKTQGMLNMLTAGVHPQIAIQTSGLFSDPEEVYQTSNEYLKKWLETEFQKKQNSLQRSLLPVDHLEDGGDNNKID